jgi:hypothetical protein
MAACFDAAANPNQKIIISDSGLIYVNEGYIENVLKVF